MQPLVTDTLIPSEAPLTAVLGTTMNLDSLVSDSEPRGKIVSVPTGADAEIDSVAMPDVLTVTADDVL